MIKYLKRLITNFNCWLSRHPILDLFLPTFYLYSCSYVDEEVDPTENSNFMDSDGEMRGYKGTFIRNYKSYRYTIWLNFISKFFSDDIIYTYVNKQYQIHSHNDPYNVDILNIPGLDKLKKKPKSYAECTKYMKNWLYSYTMTEETKQKCYDAIFYNLVLGKDSSDYIDNKSRWEMLYGVYGYWSGKGEYVSVNPKNPHKFLHIFLLWLTGRFSIRAVIKDIFTYGVIIKAPILPYTLRDNPYKGYTLNYDRSTLAFLDSWVHRVFKNYISIENRSTRYFYDKVIRDTERQCDPQRFKYVIDEAYSDLNVDKKWAMDNVIKPFLYNCTTEEQWEDIKKELTEILKE